MKHIFLILSFILINLNLTNARTFEPSVIYGDDDRHEMLSHADPLHVELSFSTAARIPASRLKVNGDNVDINSPSFGEFMASNRMPLCKSERFINQPSAGECSGFLVGDDLLVTAGHCMRNMMDCKKNRWVFNYKINRIGSSEIRLKTDDVYKCAEIIEQKLEGWGSSADDYALIRLERPVLGVRPLEFRREGKPEVGDELVVIGHPSGLPTKITDGAIVRSLDDKFFNANTDTYGGNSGSAVFNATTGVVEGILVRGIADFKKSAKGCFVSNEVESDHGDGEGITYITNIAALEDL